MNSYTFCHYFEDVVLHQIELKLKSNEISDKRAAEIAAAFLTLISEEFTVSELFSNVEELIHYAPELKNELDQSVRKFKTDYKIS